MKQHYGLVSIFTGSNGVMLLNANRLSRVVAHCCLTDATMRSSMMLNAASPPSLPSVWMWAHSVTTWRWTHRRATCGWAATPTE